MHAAFQDVRDVELLRDLAEIARRTLEALRRGARDDFQIGDLGQASEDFTSWMPSVK